MSYIEDMAKEFLPKHMQSVAIDYITKGHRPGSFLSAVLRNDLIAAAETADDINKNYLYNWACFVYNAVPVAARGSQDAIDNWVTSGGLDGRTAT